MIPLLPGSEDLVENLFPIDGGSKSPAKIQRTQLWPAVINGEQMNLPRRLCRDDPDSATKSVIRLILWQIRRGDIGQNMQAAGTKLARKVKFLANIGQVNFLDQRQSRQPGPTAITAVTDKNKIPGTAATLSRFETIRPRAERFPGKGRIVSPFSRLT
jgi:hypothetical protein